jgi:hypothetical protein
MNQYFGPGISPLFYLWHVVPYPATQIAKTPGKIKPPPLSFLDTAQLHGILRANSVVALDF